MDCKHEHIVIDKDSIKREIDPLGVKYLDAMACCLDCSKKFRVMTKPTEYASWLPRSYKEDSDPVFDRVKEKENGS